MNILDKLKINHRPSAGALDLLKYIGPGLLVTVGFIDPGNWATNLAAGSEFGYALLWVVTFSSIMLIIIQHNVAHLGIVTGLCLSEATNKYMPVSYTHLDVYKRQHQYRPETKRMYEIWRPLRD